MAEATKSEVVTVRLELDAEEAGYLYDLLRSHVGGELINDAEPLGRIRKALLAAGVVRRNAHRAHNTGLEHAALYRTKEAADAASRPLFNGLTYNPGIRPRF